MRWQTTAVVAVVLLALGAFYYVYEIKGGPARAKVEAQKGRLWTVDAGDVTEVELKRTGEVVKLKREADGWQILEPVTARGDRAKVDETLTTLTTARVDREIEPAPKRLDQYGLDTPAADITLRLKDGRQLGLQLGAKNPTGVWAYAREAGKPAVFVVSDMVLRDVTRPLVDFRDRTVLAFGQRQVTAFEVATREETLAVEQANDRWKLTRPVALPADAWTIVPKNVAALRDKVVVEVDRDKVARVDLESPRGTVALTQEGNRWRIVAPENLPADQVEAGALLFKLRELRAQGFLTDDASGIPRYLAKPTVRVTITAEAAAPTTILLGPSPDRRAGKAMAYAAVAGRGPVVLVDADALGGLARSVTELRDRTLLPAFEPRDVRTMRVP